MTRRIILTGGGTAGHVTPNLALLERLQTDGWEVHYVGSHQGIEKTLMAPHAVIYHAISSGKLRRYFSWENFIDPFRILLGILQALMVCLRVRPLVVFSKGGFVAVPIVVAAWLCRVPVISHESDITPGLANRLGAPFSRWLCVNFPQTAAYLPAEKTRVTGSPVRASLRSGDRQRGLDFLGFTGARPVVLVFGGSLGAEVLNTCLRAALDELLERYQVVHVAGRGNVMADLEGRHGYRQFEYLDPEFGDVLAAADLVVSRAGANSIYELLLTRKRHLLVPLSTAASRGDQIVNARIFEALGASLVIQEDALNGISLCAGLAELESNPEYSEAIERCATEDGTDQILAMIEDLSASRTSF